MTTPDGDPVSVAWMDDFLGELAEAPDDAFPDWEDASDLGRLHLQSFSTDRMGGFQVHQSQGAIRLTGDGVHGHSLSMSDAGQVLASFQSLVTSSGASFKGSKGLRGAISSDVVTKTELALTASPGQGSVVLRFAPASAEADERYPDGETSVGDDPVPLIEESIDTAFRVLAVAAQPGVTGDDVEALFVELGPRVASAARSLADVATKARLDLNVSWERPAEGRRRVRLLASQSATFAAILEGHALDSPIEEFEGTLRTISDRRRIEIETSDPEIAGDADSVTIPVKRGDVDFQPFRIGDRVKLQVKVQLTYRPGGAERRIYTAVFASPVGANDGFV